jgi:hypothetical protein
VRRLAAYLWAGPVSLAAAPLVAAAAATGGKVRVSGGVLEAAGGLLGPLLGRAVPGFPIAAITLGHVVLASGPRALAETRAHERVHVRQYETWGPLFPLMYLLSSVAALARGHGPHAGNAFERQAFRESEEIATA